MLDLCWKMDTTEEHTPEHQSKTKRVCPRRREKNNVRLEPGTNVEEVCADELNTIGNPVYFSVIPSNFDLHWVDVDGDHALTGERELNRIASCAAKCIELGCACFEYSQKPSPSPAPARSARTVFPACPK